MISTPPDNDYSSPGRGGTHNKNLAGHVLGTFGPGDPCWSFRNREGGEGGGGGGVVDNSCCNRQSLSGTNQADADSDTPEYVYRAP